MILEAGVSFKQLKPLPYLNRCRCGSHNICIIEKSTLGIPNYTIIKCNDCSRGIKRRTYKKAERAWNKNNPMKGGAK
jgi:hypothetical protein